MSVATSGSNAVRSLVLAINLSLAMLLVLFGGWGVYSILLQSNVLHGGDWLILILPVAILGVGIGIPFQAAKRYRTPINRSNWQAATHGAMVGTGVLASTLFLSSAGRIEFVDSMWIVAGEVLVFTIVYLYLRQVRRIQD